MAAKKTRGRGSGDGTGPRQDEQTSGAPARAAAAPSKAVFSTAARELAEALDEAIYPYVEVAWDEATRRVSPEPFLEEIAQDFDEPPAAEVVAELAGAYRVWTLARLEFWDSRHQEEIDLALIGDRLTGQCVTCQGSGDGANVTCLLESCPEGEIDEWPAKTRRDLGKALASAFADEDYGSPSDVLVADRFAWLAPILEAAARRGFRPPRRTPKVWVTSAAPPRAERVKAGREAVERYRLEQAEGRARRGS